LLIEALDRLPAGIFAASAESPVERHSHDEAGTVVRAGTAADGATIKEGSYLTGDAGQLMQIVDNEPRIVAIKNGAIKDLDATNGIGTVLWPASSPP
jgi:N12 class adenine-specific DNA methylase